jgi:hypothetical protein
MASGAGVSQGTRGRIVDLREEGRSDILERLVVLENFLNGGSDFVVFLANNAGIQHTGLGVKGVNGRVDTQLSDGTGQDSGGIQVGEDGGGGGIGQIVCRDVDGLDGGDRTLLGSGDTLLPKNCNDQQNVTQEIGPHLHATHVGREQWLITNGRGNTTEQSRNLRASLCESEDVVDEQQHVLTLLITEVLGDGQTSQSDTSTSTRGVVHLTENQGDLGVTLQVDDASLNHFVIQVITLTGTLANAWLRCEGDKLVGRKKAYRRKSRNHHEP